MLGHTVIAWMWLRQATAARALPEAGEADETFYRGNLQACRFFYCFDLPKVKPLSDLLRTLDCTTFEM